MNDALTPFTERIDIWADVWSAGIWRACWQGAIAVTLVWLVCLAWRRLSPRWQCWLWRLAVVKCALALVWVAPLELPLLAPPPPLEVVAVAPIPVYMPAVMPPLEEPLPVLEPVAVVAAPVEPIVWQPRGVVIAMGVWCLGVTICALRLGRQWWLARGLRVGAGLVQDAELVRILDEQRARLGVRRSPRLLVTTKPVGPALVGIIQPAIVLPATMLATLSPDAVRLLLRHELAHMKRRDLAWNLLLAVVGAVFFFHPFVWLALRRHRQTQESACDARVLNTGDTLPASYGQLLVDVATNFAAPRPNPAVTGVVGSARTLKQRLSAMPHFRPPTVRTTVAIVLILCVTATVGLVPWRLVAREPVDVVAEILANWEGRANDIDNLEYQVSVETTQQPSGGEADESAPPARRPARRTVTLITSGGKAAKTFVMTEWDPEREAELEYRNTSVFDGRVTRQLIRATRSDDGAEVVHEGALWPGNVNVSVYADEDLRAIAIENEPDELLRRYGYDMAQLKLVREDAVYNKIDCAELVVPRSAEGQVGQARIFVDRARDDALIGWVDESDGKRLAARTFNYQGDENTGWRITSWSRTVYRPSGDVDHQDKANVTRRRLDPPIDKTIFDLPFPTGLEVTDWDSNDDGKYGKYVVEGDGTLRLVQKMKLKTFTLEGTEYSAFGLEPDDDDAADEEVEPSTDLLYHRNGTTGYRDAADHSSRPTDEKPITPPKLLYLAWLPDREQSPQGASPAAVFGPYGNRVSDARAREVLDTVKSRYARRRDGGLHPLSLIMAVDDRITAPAAVMPTVLLKGGNRFAEGSASTIPHDGMIVSSVIPQKEKLAQWPDRISLELKYPIENVTVIKTINEIPDEPVEVANGVTWYLDPERAEKKDDGTGQFVRAEGVTVAILQSRKDDQGELVNYECRVYLKGRDEKIENQRTLTIVQDGGIHSLRVTEALKSKDDIERVEFTRQRHAKVRIDNVPVRTDLLPAAATQ